MILQALRLTYILRYTLLFAAVLAGLPFTAYEWAYRHDLAGGVFADLTGLEVFWLTIALLAATWTVMFMQGILIGAVEVEGGEGRRGAGRGRPPLSGRCEGRIGLPQGA